jgi:hypothetical protein
MKMLFFELAGEDMCNEKNGPLGSPTQEGYDDPMDPYFYFIEYTLSQHCS